MREFTPEEYRNAKPVLDRLNSHRGRLSTDTYLGIKHMALRGHLSDAMTWLRLVLEGKVKR